MSVSKVLVSSQCICSVDFITELIPASKQISLLYHLSYLCLAKFPKLEKLLRMRAVETQLLFGSSEATLLKCMGTSQNLVSSLFPMLIHAVENNKPTLAIKYLEKARAWISEIIQDVDKIVQRYDAHNKDVVTTTSDIITEKKETEKISAQLSQQIAALENSVKSLEAQLSGSSNKIAELERLINAKNCELQNHIKEVTCKRSGVSFFAAVVPFIGPIVQCIYNTTVTPAVTEKTKALEAELNRLTNDKNSLKQQEWNIQVQIIDLQMKLSKLKIDHGAIPNPVHLSEVQQYLTKIQNILLQLKIFWEKVYQMLDTIKNKTFIGEDLIDEPDEKEMFVQSIQSASKVWESFGVFCSRGVKIFQVQCKKAYSFLEIDPSALSDQVWQKQYDQVKAQMQQIKVCGDDVQASIQS